MVEIGRNNGHTHALTDKNCPLNFHAILLDRGDLALLGAL